ncbi:hypothetical protein R3P38DRAFT_722148 [Favolaschia claudopus]|uniref:Uncharacterized protein n=1 Tax=Favolaschia claudopus TaxID=2862362 RepID=A0AAV9Z4Y9_9AGAR
MNGIYVVFYPRRIWTRIPASLFLHRAWTWTRGRHRHTASLLLQILVWYFHNRILSLTITSKRRRTFCPIDGKKWLTSSVIKTGYPKDVSLLNFHTHSYSSLRHNTVRHILRTLPIITLLRMTLFPSSKRHDRPCILRFGRFADGTMDNIALDESIALVGTTVWMTEHPTRSSTERGMPCRQLSQMHQALPPVFIEGLRRVSRVLFLSCLRLQSDSV